MVLLTSCLRCLHLSAAQDSLLSPAGTGSRDVHGSGVRARAATAIYCPSVFVHADAATAPGANAEADATDGSSSSDEAGILGSSGAWANLAAQLHADIQQQPAMLKGGQLREYQMQVGWR